MKGVNRKLVWTMGLILALLVTMLGDYLALHDIAKDYVSLEVLEMYDIPGASTLPSWTGTPLEWQWIEIMFVARLVIIGLIGYFIQNLSKSIRA